MWGPIVVARSPALVIMRVFVTDDECLPLSALRSWMSPTARPGGLASAWSQLYFTILFIMLLFIIFLYAYSYGFTQVSDGVRTALSFILFIPETIYRKVVQHITSKPTQAIFHSDMTFILSGFFVYTALALYAAFNSSNESEGKDSVGDLWGCMSASSSPQWRPERHKHVANPKP